MILSVKKMRFLDNEDDSIEVLEDLLNEIAQIADNTVIADLCSVFDDEIEDSSIIGDLIETIFYIINRNGVEEGLYELIGGISKVLPQAAYCAKRLYRSILATEEFFIPFIGALKRVEPSKKVEVINILKEISNKQPDKYLEKVNDIIKINRC